MAKLIIQEKGKERIYHIQEDVITIGRVSQNHITIKDARASRRHCKISKTAQGYVVVDLKSRNGILVNGKPTERALLLPGDRIEIGEVVIYFEEVRPLREDSVEMGEDSWWLKVLRSVSDRPRKGSVFVLKEESVLIGSHRAADISVEGAATHHAQISVGKDGPVVMDLNTSQGTYVNGEKVDKVKLQVGDELRIASVHFRVGQGKSPAKGAKELQDSARSRRQKKVEGRVSAEVGGSDSRSRRQKKVEGGLANEVEEKSSVASSGSESVASLEVVRDSWQKLQAYDEQFPSQERFASLNLEGVETGTDTTAILATVLLSLALLGFFIFGFKFLSDLTSTPVYDPRAESNLVQDWSFELVSTERFWSFEGKAFVDREVFLGGKRSLCLECTPAEVSLARSKFPLSVSGEFYYFLRGYVRLEGAGPTGFQVLWRDGEGNILRRDFSSLLKGSSQGWREITAYLFPPAGAKRAELVCLSLGRAGRVWFDRISFERRDREKEPRRPPMHRFELDSQLVLEVDVKGTLALYRGLQPLFRGGEFFLGKWGSFFSQRSSLPLGGEERVVFDGKALRLRGELYSRSEDTYYPFELKVEKRLFQNSTSVVITYDFKQEVPLNWGFYRHDVSQVQVIKGEKISPVTGEFRLADVGEMIWGKREKKVVFSYAPLAAVESYREGKRYVFLHRFGEGKKFQITIGKVFQREQEEMRAKIEAAAELEEQQRYEEAMEAWRKIEKKFRYNPRIYALAQKKLRVLKAIEQSYRQDLEKLRNDILELENGFLLESSQNQYKELSKSFPSLVRQAQELLEELEKLEKDKQRKVHQEKASHLLRKLKVIQQNSTDLSMVPSYYRDYSYKGRLAPYYWQLVYFYPQHPQYQKWKLELEAIYKRFLQYFQSLQSTVPCEKEIRRLQNLLKYLAASSKGELGGGGRESSEKREE